MPEAIRNVESKDAIKRGRIIIGAAVASIALLLAATSSCEDNRPNAAEIVLPTANDDKGEVVDLTDELGDQNTGFSYVDAAQLAANTAHQSLSDKTYPDNPDKQVDVAVNCAIVPTGTDMSWLIENPLTATTVSSEGDQMTVFAGVIPLERRYSDGTLKFLTVQAIGINGEMTVGQIGNTQNMHFNTRSIQLVRTSIRRDSEEMPPKLFGNTVVYLNDLQRNIPPQEGKIPAHVTYVTQDEAETRCKVANIHKDELLV